MENDKKVIKSIFGDINDELFAVCGMRRAIDNQKKVKPKAKKKVKPKIKKVRIKK